MARQPDLLVFAKEFDIKIGTIADLIRFRLANERSLEKEAECEIKNDEGSFRLIAFRDRIDNEVHLALVKGVIQQDQPVLVRVHMPHYLNDVLGIHREDTSWPLKNAMQRIEKEGCGVIVLLNQPHSMEAVSQTIKKFDRVDHGEAMSKVDPQASLRTYGIGAQILVSLGVRKMRVMSAPLHMHGLSGFDLEVVEYLSTSER